ncbi:hypothetical protein MTR67_031597 [Solanum verrucosum]|uniref:Reverse transcriptase domain-containing protein n=1 Tax=Solanum verrucosum TaxID=315347 RepID=A0AAF0U2P5_SOLVR|nr:hypothetical protein MTR67_031597 [Solanum verrucosum]
MWGLWLVTSTSPESSMKARTTAVPTSDHGPWSRSVDRDPQHQLFEAKRCPARMDRRNIIENVLLAQEINSDIIKRGKLANVVIKLDMAQAYDRVDQRFLMKMLENMGFDRKWMNMVWRLVSHNWVPSGHAKEKSTICKVNQKDPEQASGGVLASIEVKPKFIKEIKAKQREDENLNKLKNTVESGRLQMPHSMPEGCPI